ncbi:MAG: hypothetical protein KDB99_08030 [Chitinophagaceae bacterium]|nr:hypothetical protein [Chitinophagaceae bacterium]MCB9054984.1 hypothetical protein [Chitinophagales bacterium]
MKKFLLLLAAGTILYACKDEKKADAGGGGMENKTVTLPLNPTYSSSFEMGNQEYAAMIVQGSWKDWSDNKLENMKNWLADTVVAFHSDNSMIKGADSLMAGWMRARAKYSSSIDTINAVMAVRSIDKKEDWVLVWATAIDTKLDGTVDTVGLQETWRINKDGKADLLLQYDRAKRKE